ncbi:MAG TPA: hypothetical protein VGO56_00690 [Pyrinomonadaceae bacterium]|jgi:hypothetical protein|nr:hypothetical protein [Pyrinomonadaceae bacterium]
MRTHLVAIFACCVFVAACGSKSDVSVGTNAPAKTNAPVKRDAPAKSGVPVEFSKACNAENNNKTVEVKGYLGRGDGVSCGEMGGYSECLYRLNEIPIDKKGIKVGIVQGESANQAESLPIADKDMKIHAADGSLINIADKVKLTGEMSISADGSYCSMKASKIEKQ